MYPKVPRHLNLPDHGMGPNVHLRYRGAFELSDKPVLPVQFVFKPEHVKDTFAPSEVHTAVLQHYKIHCDDFLLVSGSLEQPDKIFLVKRSEDPLKGALWPLGGRAVNCPSSESNLSQLWKDHPLDASLFLSIYRESRLQPSDLRQIRKIGNFNIVFQDETNPRLFNRDHPAEIHAVWVSDEAIAQIDLTEAFVDNGLWYSQEELDELNIRGQLLPHVKVATDAIFKSRFVENSLLDLSGYSI